LWIIPVALLLVLIIGLLWGTNYFYDFAIVRQGAIGVDELDDAWMAGREREEMSVVSYDGLILRAVYIAAQTETGKTAILAHGYNSQGAHMEEFAELFCDTFGYNVLIPDARGHGGSEGDYLGFGWHDRRDIVQWTEQMIDKVGEDAQIVLFGISMGGATVLMTSGEELPENVRAIVSDCAYTSVKEELRHQLKSMYNLPAFPFLYTTSLLCKLRAGYFFGEASAVGQVEASQTPTLFIHGEADTFVPYSMMQTLYDACPAQKEMLSVPGAGHGRAYTTDRAGYIQAVGSVLAREGEGVVDAVKIAPRAAI
jgi:fermentation-respiration switch protein FrsA (DUF1100 family)